MSQDLKTVKTGIFPTLNDEIDSILASVLGDLEMSLSAQRRKGSASAKEKTRLDCLAIQLACLRERHAKIVASLAGLSRVD
jgi:hypothetical protein